MLCDRVVRFARSHSLTLSDILPAHKSNFFSSARSRRNFVHFKQSYNRVNSVLFSLGSPTALTLVAYAPWRLGAPLLAANRIRFVTLFLVLVFTFFLSRTALVALQGRSQFFYITLSPLSRSSSRPLRCAPHLTSPYYRFASCSVIQFKIVRWLSNHATVPTTHNAAHPYTVECS